MRCRKIQKNLGYSASSYKSLLFYIDRNCSGKSSWTHTHSISPIGEVLFICCHSALYAFFKTTICVCDYLVNVYLMIGLSSVVEGTVSVLRTSVVLVSGTVSGMWLGFKKHLLDK